MTFQQEYRGKKTLITGGLGFIGSTLAIRLVKLGAEVTVLDNELPDAGANRFNISPIIQDVRLIVGDIGDPEQVSEAIVGQDFIFNLAGTLNHVMSMKLPARDLHANCEAHVTLLETCRKKNPEARILYAGTRGQYGSPRSVPVSEDHILHPVDVNGINKTAGESYHLLYARHYGMHCTSLRLSNTFGPRHQMKHPGQGVLNWFIRQIIEEKPVLIYGDGTQVRDAHYVDDVVDAMLAALASPRTSGEAYNLGGYPFSLKAFAELLIQTFGSGRLEMRSYPEEAKSVEIGDYIADCSKIKKELGWTCHISPAEGIRRTLDYYQLHQKQYW